MAGGHNKKKKKTTAAAGAAAGAARGFATTSIASKPRLDVPDVSNSGDSTPVSNKTENVAPISNPSAGRSVESGAADQTTQLSAEEFEKQLKESELQLLVEKYVLKVKRDAQRQRTRLDIDRRLLRGQATPINTVKWLPQNLMDQILDLIQAEHRFAATSVSSDNPGNGKMLAEEDATVRLWTLAQTLALTEFPPDRIQSALRYVLDISANITSVGKDSLWGLEEALTCLARECSEDELPNYEGHGKKPPPQAPEIPPDFLEAASARQGGNAAKGKKNIALKTPSPRKKLNVSYDSDIEPDELVPKWLESKEKLLRFEREQQQQQSARPETTEIETDPSRNDIEIGRNEARIAKIESDILFDNAEAETQWKLRKPVLEKEIAEARKVQAKPAQTKPAQTMSATSDADDVNEDAERIAAEILAQAENPDFGLSDIFDKLPMLETDAATGKGNNVVNDAPGITITVRDYGKWTGINPTRVLEEACRARDSSAKFFYASLSENPHTHRNELIISWTKPQEIPPESSIPEVSIATYASQFRFSMDTIATPDTKQSEAFVATVALFHIFSSSPKEEKVFMRLPPVWRDLWFELADAKKEQTDSMLRAEIEHLRDLVRQRQDQEVEDGIILPGAFRGRGVARTVGESGDDTSQERSSRLTINPEYYKKIWTDKCSTAKFQMMLQSRMQLPMWAFRHKVISTVEQNQVVIICGETGCGKSTQTPAFLLEHQLSIGRSCKIYCTEPRRISALSLAKRVSEELGENRGDLGTSRSLVGYSIRLESNTTRETRLVYATTGIVMRMLEGSNDLHDITHLVLDEVHERSIDSDFLLIVLKRLMTKRKDLKVVLMSATVDADRFSKYLNGAPVLNVPGRTYPVQVRYLEDAIELTGYTVEQTPNNRMIDIDDDADQPEDAKPDAKLAAIRALTNYSPKTRQTLAQMDEYDIDPHLVVQLIHKIGSDEALQAYSKAILVFLPGIAEIRALNDFILGHPYFGEGWYVYPLHSSIATEDQEDAFLVPPAGIRKIVLATNIAETGITIPDVTCVIDGGKHKEMRFDERRQLSRLIDTFISRANAKQRRGRAGRVQEGLCFHLFTKHRHDHLINDQQTPEMLRLSLQDLAIRVKVCKIGGIDETLGDALDPPSSKNIRRAVDALIDVRALTSAEELTSLGRQLARLPLDVFLGKLILLGTVFRCLDMAITVAAILSSKTPFSAPFGQRAQANKAREAFHRGDSDLLTVYNAYLHWKGVCLSAPASGGGAREFQFCRKNFLSQSVLANIEDLKGQLLVALVDAGFLSLTEEERRNLNRLRFEASRGGRRYQQRFFEVPQRVNTNSDNDVITASVIAWSFYPKLLARDAPGSRGLRNVGNNQAIGLHPTSMNRARLDIEWFSYYNIMKTKQSYHAHETTAVDAFAIALLCGEVRCEMYAGVLIIDGNRGRFSVPNWKTMLVIKVLRTRLREMLMRSFKQPGKLPTPQHQRWLDVLQRIYSQETSEGNIATDAVAADKDVRIYP